MIPGCCDFDIIAEFGGIGIDWSDTDYREPGACNSQTGDPYEENED